MEKLVYLKSWRETEKANVVCVHKSNKEEKKVFAWKDSGKL